MGGMTRVSTEYGSKNYEQWTGGEEAQPACTVQYSTVHLLSYTTRLTARASRTAQEGYFTTREITPPCKTRQ